MWPFRKYELGALKRADDITLEDMREHPVWVNDLSGEGVEGHDEDSQRPILGDVKVTRSIARQFLWVCILVRVVGTDIYGAAGFERDGTLQDVALWVDGQW